MEPAIQRVRRELERLDLLLEREVMRLRARYQLSLDEFRGLYISDVQVDELLRASPQHFDSDMITERAEALRLRSERNTGHRSTWSRIIETFRLIPVEQDLLFLALAPEVEPKYEILYGYLNNDVTRKLATRDLARRLFAERGDGAVDAALVPGAVLIRSGLLVAGPVPQSFQANPILTACVLAPDSPPAPPLRAARCEARKKDGWILRGATLLRSGAVFVLPGNRGSGRLRAASALCRRARLRMHVLDAEDFKVGTGDAATLSTAIVLQCRLQRAALYVRNCDVWLDSEWRTHPAAQFLLRRLYKVPLCLECSPEANWRELTGGRRVLEIPFVSPNQSAREFEWSRAARANAIENDEDAVRDLARQFVFTPGEIAFAARSAADELYLRGGEARDALFASARSVSTHQIAKLAPKIVTRQRWGDLVLPQATAAQVREVANAIRNRALVYEQWGVSPGNGTAGLNILFCGASGTGKTMSAAIVAAEAGLDLYRIDLANVVSKYIGETEKNLDRVFSAARSSNSILFFDEADAIFGKRSDVHDAHDRYANIEVAYLLQKLEEPGIFILSSNLPRNIDDAFSRRIQFHVEFPLPAEQHRERLWRGMFPAQSPVATDVDFVFLARQFHLTGGQIRNISVDAAFLAAADGHRITMPLIVKAVARHFLKQGRIPAAHEFREYFPLATQSV